MSFITNALKGSDNFEKLNIFERTMSPYLLNNSELMHGFLLRLEKLKMDNYYCTKLLDNVYNYTEEHPLNN